MPPANWFLALVVPEQAHLAELLVDLPASLRPFCAADLHITVAFLGACGAERAWRAWQAIAPLQHPAIAVVPGGWRAMGPAQNPSAYALTLAPDSAEELDQAHGSALTRSLIERWRVPALAAADLPPEPRTALPHITLARPRRRDAASEQAKVEAWLQRVPLPQHGFVVDQIALYTWADDRRNQLFTIQAQRPLDQAPG